MQAVARDEGNDGSAFPKIKKKVKMPLPTDDSNNIKSIGKVDVEVRRSFSHDEMERQKKNEIKAPRVQTFANQEWGDDAHLSHRPKPTTMLRKLGPTTMDRSRNLNSLIPCPFPLKTPSHLHYEPAVSESSKGLKLIDPRLSKPAVVDPSSLDLSPKLRCRICSKGYEESIDGGDGLCSYECYRDGERKLFQLRRPPACLCGATLMPNEMTVYCSFQCAHNASTRTLESIVLNKKRKLVESQVTSEASALKSTLLWKVLDESKLHAKTVMSLAEILVDGGYHNEVMAIVVSNEKLAELNESDSQTASNNFKIKDIRRLITNLKREWNCDKLWKLVHGELTVRDLLKMPVDEFENPDTRQQKADFQQAELKQRIMLTSMTETIQERTNNVYRTGGLSKRDQ